MHASSSRGCILHFRSNGVIGAERTSENPIGIYMLTPERIRCLPEEEVAARRRTVDDPAGLTHFPGQASNLVEADRSYLALPPRLSSLTRSSTHLQPKLL
jgi:hypothetical protein